MPSSKKSAIGIRNGFAPTRSDIETTSRKGNLSALWTLIAPHRWTLLLSLFLMLIGQAARLLLPFSTKYLMDTIVLEHQAGRLTWLLVAVLGATAIDAVTFFVVAQLLARAAETLITDLRRQIQMHIARLPVSYFDGNLTGALVSRVMSDVEGLRNCVGPGMVGFCLSLLTATMTVVVLANRSCELTLIIVGVLCLAALAVRRTFTFIQPILVEGNRIRAAVTGRLTESVGGVRVIKGYCAENREAEVFAQGVLQLFANVMRSRIGFSITGFAVSLTVGISTALVMFVGGRNLLAGDWTTGDYVQYTALLVYLVGPVLQLVSMGTQFPQAFAGLDRISEVLSEDIEDQEPERIRQLSALKGEVRFEDVSFAYEPGKMVLHEIAFVARPGTVSALVGPSGSGKSTIVSLLCAFHKPSKGRVLIDGVDLATVKLGSYRSQLGLVLQEPFLFDGTIRENILFAKPNASEARFEEACRIARVDEFACAFPSAFDTIVGERGVKLSGGQRQRLSIARAILADPRILILDEATSSLDSESEAMIQEGLNYLMRGRTTVVIAHRLSTIRRADQIFVLEAGRIVERGTHASLYERSGRYYELYTRQYGLEMNLFLSPFEGGGA
jgi:ABC-type multidrug transport system fused ATPase/permease subunit